MPATAPTAASPHLLSNTVHFVGKVSSPTFQLGAWDAHTKLMSMHLCWRVGALFVPAACISVGNEVCIDERNHFPQLVH